jgi:putative sterol carrier protein
MSYKFPSQEWINEVRDLLNASDSYQRSAKDWEGDFIFVVEPDEAYSETAYLHLQLYHGKSPGAAVVEEGNLPETEYTLSAPFSTWRKVIDGKLDPIQGMMTGQLKLKGNLMKIMRYPKAAQEIVACCALVPTDW